jgi:hypothetical protein
MVCRGCASYVNNCGKLHQWQKNLQRRSEAAGRAGAATSIISIARSAWAFSASRS